MYPKPIDIFNAFKLTPPEKVRVVIISQDPYPFGNHAHGLAFSSLQKETPASLRLILREVDRDIVHTSNLQEFKAAFPSNDLTPWANRGVFLLNSVLTVRAEQPNSHKGIGWETFTQEALRILYEDPKPKVFLTWGKEALNQVLSLGPNIHKHKLLGAGHPASGSHGVDKFSGCGHFSYVNHWFNLHGLPPINWKLNEEIV